MTCRRRCEAAGLGITRFFAQRARNVTFTGDPVASRSGPQGSVTGSWGLPVPCDASGSAALYAFRVYCGEGLFVDGGGNPESKLDLGAGLPSDPKITIGGGCDGGGICGPEPNRVIINKQDGSVINVEGPQGFGAGIGQFYWREM